MKIYAVSVEIQVYAEDEYDAENVVGEILDPVTKDPRANSFYTFASEELISE